MGSDPKKSSQTQKIWEYMMQRPARMMHHKKAEAYFGCTRIAARVNDIEAGRGGVPPTTVSRKRVTVPTRDGKASVTYYWIAESDVGGKED